MASTLVNWDELIHEGQELPTAPGIAAIVLETVGEAALAELEATLLRDPALTTKVMRLANSSLFGAAGRFFTMEHALARLDVQATRLIALSFQLAPPGRTHGEFDYHAYWKKSGAMAIIAARVARYFPEVNIYEAKVAGLLACIGQLVLAESKLANYGEVWSEARRTGEPIEIIERSLYGNDHAAFAGQLMSHWNFPPSLVDAIAQHLQPQRIEVLPEHPRELAKVLHLSLLLVDDLVFGRADRLPIARAWGESWGGMDDSAFDSLMGLLRDEVDGLDDLYSPVTTDFDDLIARARKMMVEVSLTTVSKLATSARQAEASQQKLEILQRRHDRLAQQVTIDPLTGIHNRKFFDMRLREEIKRCQRHGTPLALILFDLDHFKELNDTHGHPAGDLVLRTTVKAISKEMRSTDVLARYGGEEFALICPETDVGGAVASAERMRVCLERTRVVYNSRPLVVTASFGVGVVLNHTQLRSAEQLLELTDARLYDAKRSGRNRVMTGSV